MKTYVALLRGINVGGNNKIEMPKLKKCFESLYCTNVITYINSGNVIFDTKKQDIAEITSEIEKIIKKTFGLNIRVVLRDQNNIEKICSKVPKTWVNDQDHKTDVLFLWEKFANSKTLKLIEINPKVDSLMYVDGAIIWHLKKTDYSKSKMNNFIGSEVYKNMTARNINTVRKLALLMLKN
ncbi:DUF1697 domain-containing protein [Candidatus Falkowbacteria bacterium]|uniref:DUF1697 domain-containing protein n=1 Tax=Candidatus Buchananbacteria bacterium CG10_big_fil_rev_8_21_14_0_10_33_19 TaxID=1974525 RepID=A0A2H0W3X1_9BACT|nr:DUF1697 domain-containing protein [Candidatus Falkowbacteria bacterium]PIS06059.1 MAG: hypothetical protein COT80_04825 [Candidatus Buchananbacteria bacterium CG10_big_fil_rev_8_21_14_0_10_33_19]